MLARIILLALLPAAVLSTAIAPESISTFCQSPTVISEVYIGEQKNVKVDAISCANKVTDVVQIEKRQTPVNVCGAQCDTHCFPPSGGGPDPNECHVISDALLYDSQNVGALFNIPANASVITMQFRSCKSFFVNQAGIDEQYCRTDWSAVLDFVAFNCQSQQNAHGGLCVAADQRWFIQVQHV
ncbi:hypothetical protein QCA50_008678 [Cerrena zonata]|uniref:Uncharacterized protein n=1 Tax=Cerrena zonata TaxID=2478898 RepID=A0AAW0G9X4_9APHY